MLFIRTISSFFLPLVTIALLTASGHAGAQTGTLVRTVGSEVMEAIGRYVSRGGSDDLASSILRAGGERTVQQVSTRAFTEGGDESVQALGRLVTQYGPDIIRAAENTSDIPAMIRVLDSLPADIVEAGARRLASTQGREVAEVMGRHGAVALRAEVAHPGIGAKLVSELGQEGVSFVPSLTREQALALSRHSPDIGNLPASQRSQIVERIESKMDEFTAFLARFTETNPGKVLFTSSATVIILANSERLLGGEGDMVLDADGNPVYVAQAGMVERTLLALAMPIIKVILVLVALGGLFRIGISSWGYFRLKRLEVVVAETKGSEPKDAANRD